MLKNKYVFWSLIAIAVFGVTAAAGIFVLGHDGKNQQANLSKVLTSETGQASGVNEDVTLSAPAVTGPQISAASNVGSSLSDSSSSDASKILDPTTFAQYDKYKTSQSAQFIDLQKGTGTTVTGGSQVAVVYRGWLTNGKLFDETKTGTDGKLQAFTFVEGQHQVIPGWESALEGIKDGGVRLLIIPPTLGYGAAGQGPVPGDSVLIFQVQVVQVK